ncbi:SDR family NAD(P)-dependent oxidoreductase [Alcanivorax sp. JB21]|uniref:SDR family NAD(P)-dependent oxidoreductase n=1 Tax=Alcanivorax limicola TaxID=2874102 RepID=UPI001CBBBC02|nr:SDR family NAD(P)-dependent oxidoreductase [Alcanivorax limicola]MBZ2188267.1 SDR family NAD(P)-dependent oxidoreductase [Alcanivorax limicola]
MAIDLKGAVACVTGGARGIGYATAEALAQRGATVWIGDIDAAAVNKAAKRLGKQVKPCQLDVTRVEDFERFLAQAREDGPVRVLVNNAGIMRTGRFYEQDLAGLHQEIAVNLVGVVNGMHLVLPEMLAQGQGHIVNLSSMAGKISVPGAAVYSGTKFAVAALSRAVRAEILDSDITISSIFPAAVHTHITQQLDIRGVPTLDAAAVAAEIVASCKHGQAEVTLPRWVKPVGALEALIPDRLAARIKRVVGAERRITAGLRKTLASGSATD